MTENESKIFKLQDTVVSLVSMSEDVVSKEEFERIDDKGVEIINCLDRLAKFEAIGTVEEFKTLKEKSKPKKVIRPKGLLNEYYHEEECPHCKTEFRVHVVGYKYTQMVGETRHCPNCGQKLSWQ